MGFFGKLLGKSWQKYQAKGDKFRKQEELGLALQEYRAALTAFDGTDAEKEALESSVSEVRKELRTIQIERAQKLLDAGATERAATAIESALSHCENDDERAEVRALHRRLDVIAEDGQEDAVADAFAHAEEVAPEVAEHEAFIVLLGALDDDQADIYEGLGDDFRKGWLALQSGRFEDARTALTKAVKTHPDSPYVNAELGRLCLGLHEDSKAAEYLQKADELADEQSIYIKLHRAEALWSTEDFETAEAVLQAAHDLDEEDTRVFRAIAQHSLMSGDFEPGIEAIELVLEDTPNDVGLIRMLAQLHHARGAKEEALGLYEKVQGMRWNMDPETRELVFDPTAALAASQIYLELERKPERVIDLLHAMLAVTEGESQAMIFVMMSQAFVLKKSTKDAQECLDKALRILPDDHEKRGDIEADLAALSE